jgi:uncharacterized protein (TIGR04255 family)
MLRTDLGTKGSVLATGLIGLGQSFGHPVSPRSFTRSLEPRFALRPAPVIGSRRGNVHLACPDVVGGEFVTASPEPQRPVDFEDPPLNEVVFSVQFDGEVIDEVGVLAEFWQKISAEFPKHEKQPPLPPASESFDVPPPAPELQLRLMQGVPPQRYWFLSEDGTLIVQVQADRLMFNWRQVTGDEEYPHYDVLAPRFAELLETFLGCEAVEADAASVDWVELQYINPVETQGEEQTHGQLARILNFLVADPPRAVLPPVEDTQLQQRFRIRDDDGQPRGRLYLTAVPAFRTADAAPVYVITLLARGRPHPGDLREGVRGFLDRAHDLIVRGFVEVTTPEMHTLWRAK